MTDPTDPAAPRSTSRRLVWLAWLVAVVLTSVGHGASISYPGSGPQSEDCLPGTDRIETLGLNQSGHAGAPLGQMLALRFTCTSNLNRPFASPTTHEVRWQVVSGGGTVDGLVETSPATATFFSNGYHQSKVNWSLGAGAVGTQVVTATTAGQVFTFLATALPPGTGSGQCSDPPGLDGTQFDAERDIVGAEVWTLAGSPYRGDRMLIHAGASLQIEPGVQVCLSSLTVVGQLLAVGTAAQPIRFTGLPEIGLQFSFAGEVGHSELRHVIGQSIAGLLAQAHPLLIEDTRWQALQRADPTFAFNCNFLVGGPNSTVQVRRTLFDGFGRNVNGIGCPAVRLAPNTPSALVPSVFEATVRHAVNTGIEVWGSGPGDWQVQNCEVSGSGGDGILLRATDPGFGVAAGVAPIRGCALFSNGGLGLNNAQSSSVSVDARSNWWGSPAGPNGPGGDGISAGVDASQALTTAPALLN